MDKIIITKHNSWRAYLSLVLLFVPGVLFVFLILLNWNASLFLNWQVFVIGLFGIMATVGGVLDWNFHRNVLNMKLPKKERDAEALALGLGGLPMFILMWLSMNSSAPSNYLIPIILVLIFTVVAISYDEFVFHRKRCGRLENIYHRMLVYGNGIAWLAWFHLIYYK